MVSSGGGVAAARVKGEGKLKGKVVRSKVRRESTGPLPGSEPLKTFYLSQVRPFLQQGPRPDGQLANLRRAASAFAHLRTILASEFHETVHDLEAICEERRQLAQQVRLHRWLHGWLFVHIPLSMALFVLTVAHVIMALRY